MVKRRSGGEAWRAGCLRIGRGDGDRRRGAGTGRGVAIAWGGGEAQLLTDAVRHLVAVGFLTAVAIAMTFRLIPVLEGRALPWPRLRAVALSALAARVVLVSAQT